MEKKKLYSLISSIFIMLSAFVILFTFVVPYFRYVITCEPVDNFTEKHIFTYGLFSSSLAEDLSIHFTKFPTRDWLMILSDTMIIFGILLIISTFVLGVLEALTFVPTLKPIIKKFKNWVGLGVLIAGSVFVFISLTFFLFSNNVYKSGTTNSGYYIRHFQGSFGWWFMAVCPLVAGILAFRKGFKKFNIQEI